MKKFNWLAIILLNIVTFQIYGIYAMYCMTKNQNELAKQYGIVSAPTLVVIDGDKVAKIQNVSNIRKFADSYGK